MHLAKVLLSENSCARNMCHILLAGYKDVPSFLNQCRLIERPYSSWEICHRCAKILLAVEHKMQLA